MRHFNNLFNNSRNDNNFLYDFFNFNNSRNLHHFLDNLVNIDSHLFNSFNSFWYLNDLFNHYFNWIIDINIYSGWFLHFNDFGNLFNNLYNFFNNSINFHDSLSLFSSLNYFFLNQLNNFCSWNLHYFFRAWNLNNSLYLPLSRNNFVNFYLFKPLNYCLHWESMNFWNWNHIIDNLWNSY